MSPTVSSQYYLAQYLFTASVRHQSWPGLTGRGLTPAKVNVCLCSWEPADHQIHWQKLLFIFTTSLCPFLLSSSTISLSLTPLWKSWVRSIGTRQDVSGDRDKKRSVHHKCKQDIHKTVCSPHKLYTAFKCHIGSKQTQPSVKITINEWQTNICPRMIN